MNSVMLAAGFTAVPMAGRGVAGKGRTGACWFMISPAISMAELSLVRQN